jgi:hypothetical protein
VRCETILAVPNPYPVVINCRDRIAPLRKLIGWLERHGHQRIVLVDNASTYPPLLRYLERTKHTVVRLDRNTGHLAPWEASVIDIHIGPDEYYVETDCDVVPESFCPGDVLDLLRQVLDRYPEHCKAGLGLRIDNLPRWSSHRREIMRWENQFWQSRIAGPGDWPPLYEAPIDTTFAMYRPSSVPLLDKAIRTGFPYVARHDPWYSNTWARSREDRYYRAHASPAITSWDLPELPDRIQLLVASQPELTREHESWLKSLKPS